MRPARAAYAAIDAEVLPVEAQTTASAPSWQATEIATVMPRSLNEPVGLSPSTLSQTSAPETSDSQSECTSGVPPSRRVTGSRSSGIRSSSGAVLLDHAAPLRGRLREVLEVALGLPVERVHSVIPSTRITDVTSRTHVRPRSRSTVAASWASVASWETTTSWASSPRPSWRTVWIETSCSAKAVAISASTPARSSTSIATW